MHTTVHFDTQLLNMLAAVVIPMLVALGTRIKASSRVKAVVATVLAVVSAAITTALGEPEGGIPLYDYLFSLGQTLIASGVFYGHVLKPLGVTPAIQEATAGFGVGKSSYAAKKKAG